MLPIWDWGRPIWPGEGHRRVFAEFALALARAIARGKGE